MTQKESTAVVRRTTICITPKFSSANSDGGSHRRHKDVNEDGEGGNQAQMHFEEIAG
jgi:hypothetical protein